MKSAQLAGIGHFEFIDAPDPEPAPDTVVVAIRAVGVCGSDVHYYRRGRIGDQVCRFPESLGHECAGVVHAVPAGSQFTPGDRVAVEPGLSCGHCEWCRRGMHNQCPNVRFLGCPGMPGAYRERLAVREEQLFPIPDTMSFETAALLEPLGVGYHAVRLSHLQPGQSVAIFGAGPIGLLTLAMARAGGAGEVFVFDRLPARLAAAKTLYHADHTIDVAGQDPIACVKEKTSGRGVDIAFEAAGDPQAVAWTLEAACIGGMATIIGIPEVDSVAWNPHAVRRKELTIQNIRRSNLACDPCIDMITRGMVPVDGLVTHSFALERIAEAFELVAGYNDGIIKAMIVMENQD